MVNSTLALVFYISTLAISLVTLSLIIKNWRDYGTKGQRKTRMFMFISNAAMVGYLFSRVLHLFFMIFTDQRYLEPLHVVASIFIFVAFLAWLRLFLE